MGSTNVFFEQLKHLWNIGHSANGANCFEKLVEYFKVCQYIGRREQSFPGIDSGYLKETTFWLLNELPYCLTSAVQNAYINPSIRGDDEKFLGFDKNGQVYERCFELIYGDKSIGAIFTYNDNPSMDTITIYCDHERVHRTLSYIENEETDKDIIELMMFFVHNFFEDQMSTLEEFIMDIKIHMSVEFFNLSSNHVIS